MKPKDYCQFCQIFDNGMAACKKMFIFSERTIEVFRDQMT